MNDAERREKRAELRALRAVDPVAAARRLIEDAATYDAFACPAGDLQGAAPSRPPTPEGIEQRRLHGEMLARGEIAEAARYLLSNLSTIAPKTDNDTETKGT